jgi:hypothetical protein
MTSTPLGVHIKEHKYNLTKVLLEKSKSAQHAYAEGHKICWNEMKVLQIEPNTTYIQEIQGICPHVRSVNPAWTSHLSGLLLSQ